MLDEVLTESLESSAIRRPPMRVYERKRGPSNTPSPSSNKKLREDRLFHDLCQKELQAKVNTSFNDSNEKENRSKKELQEKVNNDSNGKENRSILAQQVDKLEKTSVKPTIEEEIIEPTDDSNEITGMDEMNEDMSFLDEDSNEAKPKEIEKVVEKEDYNRGFSHT